MIEKEPEVLLFFTPEAGVVPHYAAQCVLARTMQERGHQVLLARCFGDFSRCPVMDMVSAPYDFTGEAKAKLCGDCKCIAEQVSRHYGLRSIDISSFVTPDLRTRVAEVLQNAPHDLRQFVFEGVHFGKLVAGDLVCAAKCSNFDNLDDSFRYNWLRYVESSLLAYLAVQTVCHRHGISRILFFNEYSLNLGVLWAGRRLGIPTFSVTQAAHLNLDRRRFIVVPEILGRSRDRCVESWDTWRNLTLSVEQVREVGDDIMYRLAARGSHIYSPGKTVKQSEFFEHVKFSQDRKLLAAFTSSLDECLAAEMYFEGLGQTRRKMKSPFRDQLDWLKQLTAFVETSDNFQLVVRVHPREGANKRDKAISQHLLRLKAAFDREMPHCRFIWPEDKTSSYDLVEIADVVLTSWTTVGFEAARLGVPVLKAFGNLSYPDDNFWEWAPTVDEYFGQLARLCEMPASEERLLHVFRCHYAMVLGSTLDLGDVIPASNFDGVPPFRMPKEAAALEDVIISLKKPMEINVARLAAAQNPERAVHEKRELGNQMLRIIHFLHTGEDHQIRSLKIEPSRATNPSGHSPVDGSPSEDEARITVTGNNTQYRFHGQIYCRYSPLAARLAQLCGTPAEPVAEANLTPQRRPKYQSANRDAAAALQEAGTLFRAGRYFEAFDVFERIADENPNVAIPVLAEAYEFYQQLPEQNRYDLYQGRIFDFGIRPTDKVLDIGSGHLPFPMATHLADIALEDGNYGRAGMPFKYVKGRPVYECNIEEMSFRDREFDFVYCSHVLEHTQNPEKACQELMRVAKRGYIETPTRGKDLWLNTAKVSHHRWGVEFIHDTLLFTEYTTEEIEGLRNDILMQMHCGPQTSREKAFSALIYLKPALLNTMVLWEGSFQFEVRRVSRTHQSFLSASTGGIAVGTPTEAPNRKKTTTETLPRPSNSKSGGRSDRIRDESRSILFINTYYTAFLERHYRTNRLSSVSYQEQFKSLVSACFGDSDFYSRRLKELGWQTEDLIVNCLPLQKAWAKEQRFAGSGLEVALEQIRRARPSIVYLQDLSLATTGFLSAIRQFAGLIVGQIACPLPEQADLSQIDIIFSSFPHFVDGFRSRGVTAYYLPLAFDPLVLTKLSSVKREFPVTFIGGLSAAHGKGSKFLDEIARLVPIDFWGYGVETVPPDSAIRTRHHGEVWGLEMFLRFSQSRLTLNRHIDVAENYANNMRLFEATGCGSLLITDYKDNLNELFEVGKEVVAYRSVEECAALIKYYLAHPNEAEAIARAGQERTLRDHNYAKRMEKVAEILERQLRYRREEGRYGPVDLSRVSYGYTPISADKVSDDLTFAWKNPDIPARQRALVQQELEQMFCGKTPSVFQVLGDALRPIAKPGTSVLEIGCSSGYYYEVLEYLLKRSVDYTGVDYSEAMIAMAADYYPKAKFKVADGTHLPFDNEQFEVAISSCILLHVPNYVEHIAEAARVAKRYVVAHRTPICRERRTQYLTKFAYDVQTVELRFNEQELLTHFAKKGLELVNGVQYESRGEWDEFEVTYLFSKKANARVMTMPISAPAETKSKATPSSGLSASLAAVPSPQDELSKLKREMLSLFTEAGLSVVRACLDGLATHEKLAHTSEKLVQKLIKPSGMELLQSKLQLVKSRAEGNFRFYLQPQLEKFFLWLLESNETTNYTYDLDPLNKEYLASTVALVTRKPVEAIQAFINEISNDNELREHIRESILESPHRLVCDLNVQFGRRVGWYAFVRAVKPRVVVETGVEKGMGTCVIARALMRNELEGRAGISYGTDIDLNAGFLVTGPYAKYGKVLYGDSIETLRKFSEPIDLFINDSAHSMDYERQEYAAIKDKLTDNAIILGDDSHNSDELRRFALATGRQFLFFSEKPLGHWYPGAGIGIAFKHH